MISRHALIKALVSLVLVWVAATFTASQPQPVAAQTLPICTVGGSIAQDTTWSADCVYVVENDVTVEPSITLTVQPGTVVKFIGDGPGSTSCGDMRNQRNLFVKGTLDANGTSSDPVYFTSLRDDTVGGDTNDDGVDSVPAAGNWGRIEFFSGSNSSSLTNAVVRYAGSTDYKSECRSAGTPVRYGAIVLDNTSPTIDIISF